jgi:hypothetical protein
VKMRTQRSIKKQVILKQYYLLLSSTNTSITTTNNTTTTCSFTGELKHKLSMIPEQSELYECQLCQNKFGSHDLLETHFTFSQLHEQKCVI